MKKLITTLLCIFALSNFIIAQENEIKIEEPNFYNLILYKDTGLSHSFCDYSGNILSYKVLNQKLLECPDNETIVKQAQGWMIADGVFMGLTLTSGIIYTLYTVFPEWNNSEVIKECSMRISLTSLFLQLLSGTISLQKYNEACDNYNLYILGIPVK